MARLHIALLLGVILGGILCLAGAEETGADESTDTREKRAVPNWGLTASDFFGWVEELRRSGGYEKMEDLGRTFWAHFPSADRLGYGPDDPGEE